MATGGLVQRKEMTFFVGIAFADGSCLSGRMTGTLINAAAIVAGGIFGRVAIRQLANERQVLIKHLLGVFTVYAGLSLTWNGLNGSWRQVGRQLLIVVAAMMIGKILGRLLRLQRGFNRLGQFARRSFEQAGQGGGCPNPGFVTCAILFCAEPLAALGAVQDGLTGSYQPLVLKAIMDGLATVVFARTFGWGAVLSAVPVLAYQGTLTLLVRQLEPWLRQGSLVDGITATNGLLIFCVALVILELKKVDLADYLPSLAIAPLLTWWLR